MKNLGKYIPFLMFILALGFNSCSDDLDEKPENTTNFDSELRNTIDKLYATQPITSNNSFNKSFNSNNVYLSKEVNNTFIDTNLQNSIFNLQDLVDLKNQHNLQLTDSIILSNDLIKTYTLSEQQVLTQLQPSIQEAKNFFYSKGFNDFDIAEMLDGEDEYTLIPIVMEVSRNLNSSNNNNVFQKNAVRDCFLETTGIAAGIALVSALTAATLDKTLVKKLIKKAIKKIGARVLGGIGLALMVIDFAWCVSTYEDPAHFAPNPS